MTTQELREKAARFYFKHLTGDMEDWIEGREDGSRIDEDVRSLADLLKEVHDDGHPHVDVEIDEPVGNCDGSGLFRYDASTFDGRGERLAEPCPGCRACR
jgi:hypothetical protein